MNHSVDIHNDDASYTEESIAHTSSWIEKVLPLVTDDHLSLEKLSDPPKVVLEPLPSGLNYAFLGSDETWPMVISFSLSEQQEGKLLDILRNHGEVIKRNTSGLKGISPIVCKPNIHYEKYDPGRCLLC